MPPVSAVVTWRFVRAIPTSAKFVALGSMTVSGVVVGATAPVTIALVSSVVLVASALYVGTRPAPSTTRVGDEHIATKAPAV